MQLGYIDECPEVGFRAHIYDFDKLSVTQSKFCKEFWDRYRVLKASNPDCDEIAEVRQYFKRKSASERQSINYPIQARASAIYKIAMVNFFKWVVDNNLFGIVKFCIPCHDETNLEAPEDIAEEVAAKLHECMVKAGKFICKIVPLEAEVSRHKVCIKDFIHDGVEVMTEGDVIAIIEEKVLYNMTKEKKFVIKDLPKEYKKHLGDDGPLPTYWIH